VSRSWIKACVFLLCSGCDSSSGDPSRPQGTLEYEGGVFEGYRLERRIEIVAGDQFVPTMNASNDGRGCGILTDRAFDQLETTIAGLDPGVDYDFGERDEECSYTDNPAARIYLPGFEHSPFSCDEFCCNEDLMGVPLVYLHVFNNLAGTVLVVDGEPYVAIDPDQSCP